MVRFSLTSRAFLFSFVPVCLVLSASFFALSSSVQERVKLQLREALQESDVLLGRTTREHSRQTSALLSQLADSSGVKAAVGLIVEVGGNPMAMQQVRRTIEVQLRDLQASTGYDLVAVSDPRGKTIAAVLQGGRVPAALPLLPPQPGLAQIDGLLYELESVPIEIAGEPVAALTLGRTFDWNVLPLQGGGILLHGGKIALSTFPSAWSAALQEQIQRHCATRQTVCELTVHNEHFLVSQLDRTQLGNGYRLLGFRSLSGQLQEFHDAFMRILIEVGLAGMLLALLSTAVTSRSVSRPLRSLMAQLARGESKGGLPDRLDSGKGIYEIDLLVSAFNRVGEAERRSRRDLVNAKHAAESANRLKTEFLTNISHELRTPLNGVVGMTGLLMTTTLSNEQEEYAQTVRECAESLSRLIDDVLDFSELETAGLRVRKAPFDLPEVIRQLAAEAGEQAARKAIQFDLQCTNPLPDAVIGDAERIRRVMLELVGNAVKFTGAGQVAIVVSCERTGAETAELRFDVTDTGIGIPPEAHDLVFQKFSQIDGSLTRRNGGTGLGLALSKAMVEAMGGQIGFESKPKSGSRFWFTLKLPLCHAPANAPANSTIGAEIPC